MYENEEACIKRLQKFLSSKGIACVCNIAEILGEEQIIKFSENLCSKYDFAGSARSQFKEAILQEAQIKGEDFYSETKLSLDEYFSHDYDNSEEKDNIFKGKTARLDLMIEQLLDDAVVLDTAGTIEIYEVLSKVTDEQKKNIFQFIRDEDIREFFQSAFETRLTECKEKYKWYRNYLLRLKRLKRRLVLKDNFNPS